MKRSVWAHLMHLLGDRACALRAVRRTRQQSAVATALRGRASLCVRCSRLTLLRRVRGFAASSSAFAIRHAPNGGEFGFHKCDRLGRSGVDPVFEPAGA